jgi:hypothetical protein
MECRFFKQVYEKHIKLKYLIGKDKVDDKYIYNIDYIDYLKDVYSSYCNDDYCRVKCDIKFCIDGDTYIYRQCAKPTDLILNVLDCAKINVSDIGFINCNRVNYVVDFINCNDIKYDVMFNECNKINYSINFIQCNQLDIDVTINSCNKILSVTGVIYDNIYTRIVNNN